MQGILCCIITMVAMSIGQASAFNLPGITNILKPPTKSVAVGLADDEKQLLQAISNTGNGKNADIETQARVLSIVRRMETNATPSSTLLSNPEEVSYLPNAA